MVRRIVLLCVGLVILQSTACGQARNNKPNRRSSRPEPT